MRSDHSNDHDNIAMGSGGEFDAIRALLTEWGELASGIGDDAAVFVPPAGEQLVLTVDSSIEDVHFRESWLTPEEIGARAASAALSDIAAMGARALSVLVALEVPKHWTAKLPAVAAGIGHSVRNANACISGGNITRAEKLGITITAVGSTSRPVYRTGARDGDSLWVTGKLGGPQQALRSLLAGEEPASHARARFAAPVARLAEGKWLSQQGASAMLDISDGLIADAGHMAAASGVNCEIWLDSLPCMDGVTPMAALVGGEEYELLASAPSGFDADEFMKQHGISLTRIGAVRTAEPPGVTRDVTRHVTLLQHEGSSERLHVDLLRGHDHFSQ